MADYIRPMWKYYNTRFCKFSDKCRYKHNDTICKKDICKNKKCHHIHPKVCRYKDTCRRRSTCLYYHIVDNSSNVYSALQNKFGIMKVKLEDSTKKIVEISTYNVESPAPATPAPMARFSQSQICFFL